MKERRKEKFFYGLKGFTNFLLVLIGILITCLTACSKEEINEEQFEDVHLKSSLSAVSAGTSIEEITFTAVALIEYCHGESIRFTGTIENRTKEMTGTGLKSGTEYDVLGGAEMFAIKDAVLNPNGSLNLAESLTHSDIVIHQGTLVFRNQEDGSIVVARHIIRKVPGSSTTINEWKCGGFRDN